MKPGKGPGSKLMSFRDLLSIDPWIICRILTINPNFEIKKSIHIKTLFHHHMNENILFTIDGFTYVYSNFMYRNAVLT